MFFDINREITQSKSVFRGITIYSVYYKCTAPRINLELSFFKKATFLEWNTDIEDLILLTKLESYHVQYKPVIQIFWVRFDVLNFELFKDHTTDLSSKSGFMRVSGLSKENTAARTQNAIFLSWLSEFRACSTIKVSLIPCDLGFTD